MMWQQVIAGNRLAKIRTRDFISRASLVQIQSPLLHRSTSRQTSPVRPSSQDLYNRHRHHLPANAQRHYVGQREVLPLSIRRRWTRSRRIGVYLDPPIDEIDDPVYRDAGTGIDTTLVVAVVHQSGIGHLDEQDDVRRNGMMLHEAGSRTGND